MDAKILITGSSGFLGKHLQESFRNTGVKFQGLTSDDVDLTDSSAVERLGKSYETIIHLATWTRAGSFCREQPGEQWLINEKINLNVVDLWSKQSKPCHLISFGTSVAYPEGPEMKVEEKYLQGDPITDYYGYSTTKRSLLYGILAAHKQYGSTFSHFIPSTIYGPSYHQDERERHFIFDIMRKIIVAEEEGGDVVLWGDGNQIRELIFVDDVVDIITASLKNPSNRYINLSSGNGITIKDLALQICEIVGLDKLRIKFDQNAFVGTRAKVLSTALLDSVYPQRKRTCLQEGLKATVDWMRPLVLQRQF